MNKPDLYTHMKNMVIEAIKIIQLEAADFSLKNKIGYDGKDDDLVTSADLKAQDMYIKSIQEHFPNEGIIGEENNLNIKPKNTKNGYFTLDPLDGTRSFGRLESKGTGTMISHVQNGTVDAVCIGDINTSEIFGYGPYHLPTRTRFGIESILKPDTSITLSIKYAHLLSHPEEFPEIIQKMVSITDGGLFRNIEVNGGSIGLVMARIWKSEVAMIILRKGFDTPWDNTPVIGMNNALGFVDMIIDENNNLKVIEPDLPLEIKERSDVHIIVHKNYLEEMLTWIEENK
jgi:hypothetical protein